MKTRKEWIDKLIMNEENSGVEVSYASDSKNAAASKRGIKGALVLSLVVIMVVGVSGCSGRNSNEDNQVTNNTLVVEETSEITEEIEQSEGESTEEVTEPIEDTTTEESKSEMVEFETWAKQEGNDEVCVVVWNEELGIQEIIPTVSESGKVYEIQKGDRFAIPYREGIVFMGIRDQSRWNWENYDYYEFTLPKGEISIVDVAYDNEAGEGITLTYSFK